MGKPPRLNTKPYQIDLRGSLKPSKSLYMTPESHSHKLRTRLKYFKPQLYHTKRRLQDEILPKRYEIERYMQKRREQQMQVLVRSVSRVNFVKKKLPMKDIAKKKSVLHRISRRRH